MLVCQEILARNDEIERKMLGSSRLKGLASRHCRLGSRGHAREEQEPM